MRRIALALALGTVALGCASNKPRPTLAGSTPVLRLMRDWRGVWKGSVKDSPMGGMPYVLYVEEVGPVLRARMAPSKDPTLESVKQAYELVNFVKGKPHIRYVVSQRSSTQKGELEYREDLSSDESAVFCLAEVGCDKLKVIFLMQSQTKLTMRTLVDEAPHSDLDLSFASAEIPKAGDELEEASGTAVEERPQARPAAKPAAEKADTDVYLEEHVDKDVAESKATPADPGAAAPAPKGKGKKGKGN
jgi:hypothetical protein